MPILLNDIKAIADAETESQTDRTFKKTRLYIRLSTVEVREQLIEQKGDRNEELPTAKTIRVKLYRLGSQAEKVKRSEPKNG